jgi:hypothetical protein
MADIEMNGQGFKDLERIKNRVNNPYHNKEDHP